MYIAVCDDRPEELSALLSLLEEWHAEHPGALRYRAFHSASDLLDAAERERFTLYLLDVMMPGTNGMEAARELRGFDTAADIVFLTSSPGFAYESYGVQALDYLLKPIGADILFPLLDRLHRREEKLQEALTLRSGATFVRIPFSRLAYVEVSDRHLYFHLSDGQVHPAAGRLKDYEPVLLSRPEFSHIHRSYIVNLLHMEEFSPAGVRMFSGESLPVSRLLFPQLQKEYLELLFAEREERA